jgi:TonB family protein
MSVKFHFLPFLVLLLVYSNIFAQKPPPKIVYGEIVNDKAVTLPEPVYPAAAKAVRASGTVNVQVTIDENGDVINAAAISGHPLLRAAAVQAARQAKFLPSTVNGEVVKITGTIVYIFIFSEQWQAIGEALGDSEVEIEDAESLARAAEYLANVYPEISKSIKGVAENFTKDEQSARFQTIAVGDIIGQIQTRLANRASSLWYFELGLTVGRIKAGYFDETILRTNLPKLKELADFYPPSGNQTLPREDWSENLKKLCEMANQPFFSRKDKSRVKMLIGTL